MAKRIIRRGKKGGRLRRRIVKKRPSGKKVGKFVTGYKYTRYRKRGDPGSGIEEHDRRKNPVGKHYYGKDPLEKKKIIIVKREG